MLKAQPSVSKNIIGTDHKHNQIISHLLQFVATIYVYTSLNKLQRFGNFRLAAEIIKKEENGFPGPEKLFMEIIIQSFLHAYISQHQISRFSVIKCSLEIRS